MIGRVALLVTFKKAKPKSQSLSRSHIRDLASINMKKLLLISFIATLLGTNLQGQVVQDTILINAEMDTVKMLRWISTQGEFGGTLEELYFYRLPIGPPHHCGLKDTSHWVCSQLFADYTLTENIQDSIIRRIEFKQVFVLGNVSELISEAILQLDNNPNYLWNMYLLKSHAGAPQLIVKMENGRKSLFEIRTTSAIGGWTSFEKLINRVTLANNVYD